MNETKQRIAEYKKKLPGLKEKVIAVALLLVFSATMLTTVSFAWLSLSNAPEVTGVSTSIASNGNLEIALATGTRAPAASQVGDSKLPLEEKNITWGNLINLSDPAYGLDNLVLRPALLNKSSLLDSPLYGATYTKDGRIESFASNFGYGTWVPGEDGKPGYFGISDELGVRAISSTKLDNDVGPYAIQYDSMKNAAINANVRAINSYNAITQNEAWMNSLATIMGTYMTARLNASEGEERLTNPTMNKEDIENLRDMFDAFIDTFELEVEALASLANFQLYVLNGGHTTEYTPFTAETLLAQKDSLSKMNVQITNLNLFVSDYDKLKGGYSDLEALCKLGTIKWLNNEVENGETISLNAVINNFVDVGTCTLKIKDSSDIPLEINSIGASNALGFLSKSCIAVITNGILKNFEQRTGATATVGESYNSGQGLLVEATVKRSIAGIPIEQDGSIYAIITTNAEVPSLFEADLKYAVDKNTGGEGVSVAKDTYALAVDLWVRTNAQGSYLTLEGNILTETSTERAKGKDMNGNEVELWSYSQTIKDDGTGESQTVTEDVYQLKAENGTKTWYYANGHMAIEGDISESVVQKMIEVETVIGYEGENRVWQENASLSINSTTQGSGSCYVYYADTPENQARSLKLLSAMNVVFIDDAGKLLATAYMDTLHYYADNGKVIVPLVLSTADSINLGQDYQGNVTYAIMPLEQNVATRVTALVYLDGTKLTNDDVLASADIQGQLNIQFGSSEVLTPIEDEALQGEELVVSATVSPNSFNYDTATADNPMTTEVTVTVEGSQPDSVTAFFIRSINSTQGSREEKMTFTDEDKDGVWTAAYTFKYPGNYILRSVQLDGVEYDLKTRPTVTVEGFTLKSLAWNAQVSEESDGKSTTIMTADNSSTVDLYLQFATNDVTKMPKSVQGRFMRQDGTTANINFSYSPTNATWSGTATFVTSGEYTLQYLVMDGQYVEIAEEMQKDATVYLGMKVAVYTDSPLEFLYQGDSMADNQQNLYMKVKVMDDTGTEMLGLSNVKLYYKMRGSSVAEYGMDADLIWNGKSEYYEGAFESKIGMYDFTKVEVGANIITIATTSPSFIIISPEPPTFNIGSTPEYQYKPDSVSDPAILSVKLKNADALPYIKAVLLKDGVEQDTWVDGEINTSGDWVFIVPKDASTGGQDGEWAIKEIRIAGVYAEDGTPYTEENPLVFDMTGVSGVSTKVVSKLSVRMNSSDAISFSGNFMDAHTIEQESLAITVTDANGDALPQISDVTLKYNYLEDSVAKGGYSIDTATIINDNGDFTVTLVNQGNGTYFVQKDAITLTYAGTYQLQSVSFTFMVGGTPCVVTLSAENNNLPAAPIITVTSSAPTVAIKSISITGTNQVYTGSSYTDATWSMSPSTATVYFKAGEESVCGSKYYNYTPTKLTMELKNSGSAKTATLTFSGASTGRLYSAPETYGDNSETTEGSSAFVWENGDGEQWRWVGYCKNQTGGDSRTAAGEITASALVLTDAKGNTYTVNLSTPITINNPY